MLGKLNTTSRLAWSVAYTSAPLQKSSAFVTTIPDGMYMHCLYRRVYRTRDFAAWGANAPRLAQRLVREGQLLQLAHGMFTAPKRSRFGVVPPTDEALMRAFLTGGRFVFTGPERWNALGLGTTAVFALPLIYNTKRSGQFKFGGREFLLRRVAFPEEPTPEWFVVDLFENADRAAASLGELTASLTAALRTRRFNRGRLLEMAHRFGSRRTLQLVRRALDDATQAEKPE